MRAEYMKLVFVNRFFYPDHSATSQLLTDLALHLAKSGRAVFVVTGRQVYDDPTVALPARSTVQGVEILRVWTSRFGRGRLWGRAIDYGTFYLSALWCLLKHVRPGDVIIAKTDPPLISVLAAVVSKVRGAVLINWIQDLFPEVASALAVQGAGWLEQPLRNLRNRSLRAARCNVVIGEGMANKLRDEGLPPNAIRVIHNWADGLAIRPVEREKNDLRIAWGLQNKFVVGYSGNFGRAHEFETILSAAGLLRVENHIAFLFIGAGAQLEWMKQEVEKRNLKNVFFKPYQPRDRLAVSLSVPDIHLISLQPALEGLIVPSKFYGIAAAGRPTFFIGSTNGELSRILQESDCGFSMEIGQADKATHILKQLAKDPDTCTRLGQHARALFDRRFSTQHAMREWDSLIAGTTDSIPQTF